MNKNTDLVQYIAAIPDFPEKGILFRDISPLLKVHFVETIDAMSDLFSEEEWASFDLLAGIDSRGFIFASALAYKHKKGFLKVRKAGKLPNVHSSVSYGLEYGNDSLEMQVGDGSRILVLDDLIATGGSMGAAVELCEKVGYKVSAMACLVDLKALNSFVWKGMSVRSLVQYND